MFFEKKCTGDFTAASADRAKAHAIDFYASALNTFTDEIEILNVEVINSNLTT
ncbi:hypothetical protein ABIB50_005356 [Mucilaginibacter sp. UYCu711]